MQKRFSKYLNAVCTPEDFRIITEWLANHRHQEEISAVMKESWEEQFLEETDPLPGQEAVWTKIRLAISRNEKEILVRQRNIFRWGFGIAAILALMLLVNNFMQVPQTTVGEKTAQMQTFTVPNGARSTFTLPDGSQVWLNSGTTLSYASDFGLKRVLNLEGEAFFDVVKSTIPFIINTSLGTVEVTGTSLNVNSSARENHFETTVEEGSVLVQCPQAQDICRLEPGQQVRWDNGEWEVRKVETDIFTSWKDGKIIFRKEYLPDVARRLERWYNVKIELDDDPRLKTIHYTGTLEMESFSEVLELLTLTASINYTYNDKTRVIRITHRK